MLWEVLIILEFFKVIYLLLERLQLLGEFFLSFFCFLVALGIFRIRAFQLVCIKNWTSCIFNRFMILPNRIADVFQVWILFTRGRFRLFFHMLVLPFPWLRRLKSIAPEPFLLVLCWRYSFLLREICLHLIFQLLALLVDKFHIRVVIVLELGYLFLIII